MRLPILTPPYEPGTAELLHRWMRGTEREPLALFRVLATHPLLPERMQALSGFQLGRESSLGLRTRELLIDRTCARCGCEYEWGVHAAIFATAAGLSLEDLAASAAAPAALAEDAPPEFSLVDELHDTGTVSDSLWPKLTERWSPTQILEMLVLVGWYHAISYVANAAMLPLESWAERFPPNAVAPSPLRHPAAE